MKTKNLFCILLVIIVSFSTCTSQTVLPGKILLRDNWAIQSSKDVKVSGSEVSSATFKTAGWYPATVPSTVVGTLVTDKVYPDPYFGTNIESLPGYFSKREGEIPDASPFRIPWWYRTVFPLPAEYKGKNIFIKFHSINYKANVWLNGKLVADTSKIEGAYRLYNLNITPFAIPGGNNCLALEIFPPKGIDLTITWVDWNPTPPDRGMGIWYDVEISPTGNVAIDNPKVVTKLNLPSADKATITISAEVKNNSGKKVSGVLEGRIENISFSQSVTLDPDENKSVTFDPSKFSQLEISNPRLWWPYTVGPQNLYDLELTFSTRGTITDAEKVRFGIREITSWMNNFNGKHTKVFQVNGKNIVVRGGGYVQDLFLRPSDDNIDKDIRYAKHMGLNALRMEAPRGSDYLFEKCDEEGILLMVGWCCCSSWEQWKRWTPNVESIAQNSWTDLIVHLRNHPSVFTWLYGSDNFPPENVEKMYIQILKDNDGTRPYESSATQDSSTIAGHTGLWMGPYPNVYAYETPAYWYSKLEFNTEAGPSGEQIPPVESMRKMMPAADLWPMSHSWDLRLHKAFYPQARKALYSRYGQPLGVEEYSMKSQVLNYEATRAMFEAFAANKYRSSGIIYWMYNSAWPKMYWQFYDYFFAPNGAFYGTKEACEPLHIQYSYDDGSIRIVNSLYKEFPGLKATIKVYDLNMEEKYSKEVNTGIKSDESLIAIKPELPENPGEVYFIKLRLEDSSGKEISSNFYWLSDKGDAKADFTALNKLPKIELNASVISASKENGRTTVTVEIGNPTKTLAFSVNPKILKGTSGDLVLPIFWDDNYFSLLPGEKRTLKAEFSNSDLGGESPVLGIDGWNIIKVEKEIK
jgi:exo-1,4-beta-D-glucosaminidase